MILKLALLTALLCTPAYAKVCANWMTRDQYNYGVVNKGLNTSPHCEVKDIDCFCFDDLTEWSTSEVVEVFVDDLTKPIIDTREVEKCEIKIDDSKLPEKDPEMEAEEWAALHDEAVRKLTADSHEECKKKISEKKCDEGFSVVSKFEDEAYEFACQKLLGYEQKFGYKNIQPNPEKERKFKEDQVKEQIAQAEDKQAEKVLECGKKVKKLLLIRNAKKNPPLTKAEIKQFHKTFADLDDLLEGGSLNTARDEMLAAKTDSKVLTEEDKAEAIKTLDGCKL
jgi:hypothetical protein